MARKSYWDKKKMSDKLGVIEAWVTIGLNEKEMYTSLGVSADTWIGWKNDHPELEEVLEGTPNVTIGELVESAKKQAIGYYIEETQRENGSNGFKKVVKKKYITPNGHMTKYLLNNLSDKFADKSVIEHEIHGIEDYFSDEKRVKKLTELIDEKE